MDEETRTEVGEEEIAAFRAGLEKCLAQGRPHRLLAPLPRRVRLRLWRDRQANTAGSWLCGHHAGWAAVMLWRSLGMWQ